ncbi:MAG TPA: adenylyl-sulfate kinase [Desulfarculaceae bacterium]|nr:adenylyl-sulfate kinase [Desulfarculaceae bacterium]
MQYETKKRSIFKAISWRTWATITTAIIVFIFTGEFALAITIGFLEVIAKMILYFFHERLWQKINYGKKEIPSFVLWFTGLPASGKKALADAVYQQLGKEKLKIERLDSLDVRPLFPETGFSPAEVDRHVKRTGHLCAMLGKNGVIVIASFVSPYRQGRDFARSLTSNFVEVYMKTTVEDCRQRDTKGHYTKAQQGEYRYFPGVDIEYEKPLQPEITIEVDKVTIEESTRKIIRYLKENFINGK